MNYLSSILNKVKKIVFKSKPVPKKYFPKEIGPTIKETALSFEGFFNVQNIVDITGKSRDTIGKALRKLRDDGALKKYDNQMWKRVVIQPPEIPWGIPDVGSQPSVIVDGPALNALIRKTILEKDKLFTIPSICSQLRIDDQNGRIQRIIYKMMKEGLVANTKEKDLSYSTPPYLYKVL